MRVLHVNAFDTGGGAARAAMRLHDGLLCHGIDSHLVAVRAVSGTEGVSTPLNKHQVLAAYAKRHTAFKIASLQKTPTNRVIHSLGLFSSGLANWINATDYDVVNLHWVCAEALSISEIGRINKPIVWTMHDMWPFMGAEHYDDLEHPGRWKANYTSSNRPPSYTGPDLDAYVWRRKSKLWAGKTFHLVAPSNWLAECARSSALMRNQPCEVIHNPLDTSAFSPVDQIEARRVLGVPLDKKLILFGAMGATSDSRKGYDLLVATLREFERTHAGKGTEVIVFGGRKAEAATELGLKTHFLGTFHDDISLRVVYSAADVFVAPSRQDNLPNTVVEAGACGLPTAAFDVGGMSDIISDGGSGILAKPFDTKTLAHGIGQLLEMPIARNKVRALTESRFSLEATLPGYLSLYRRVLKQG